MTVSQNSDHGSVRRRPPWLRSLGDREPPGQIVVGGQSYRLLDIFKHDFWAATAIYVNDAGDRVICKFNRLQSVGWIPMAWVGRVLAAREAGFLRRLSNIELVPRDLGSVAHEGRRLPNAVARAFVDGEPFRVKEQVTPRFFDELKHLLAGMHAAGMAYVDLHKRENIIVGRDGRPHLIDFQVCFGLSPTWPGSGRLARYCLAKLQEMDLYHFRKHLVRCFPETLSPEQRLQFEQPPRFIRWHRKIAVPFRTLRRKLLVSLRVRDAGGQASSELEPEAAYREMAGKTRE